MTNTSNSSGSNSSFNVSSSAGMLSALPVIIIGVLAVEEEVVVLAAMENLFGAGVLASIVTEVLTIVGAVTVGIFGVLALIIIVAIIAMLANRTATATLVSVFGCLYFGIAGALALTVFSSLPTLTALVLSLNVILYVVAMLFTLFGISFAIILAE